VIDLPAKSASTDEVVLTLLKMGRMLAGTLDLEGQREWAEWFDYIEARVTAKPMVFEPPMVSEILAPPLVPIRARAFGGHGLLKRRCSRCRQLGHRKTTCTVVLDGDLSPST
jgi:hypothetical protein